MVIYMKNRKPFIEVMAEEDAGLLETVKRALRHVPAGTVKSYLEHRQISVDGVITSQFNYPVKRGQTVRITITNKKPPVPGLEIIYEDHALLAINKPAGLLSVASDTEREKTAYRLLKDSLGEPLYVVHRLDRETSGVLLFAKSKELRDALQNNWASTIRREYLAVCEGVFKEKRGRCDTVLRETVNHIVYSAPSGEGKRAVTNYEVLKENGRYSLVRILLETGRKNQIRVHMKELSHPVVGDKKYGASGNPLGRLGLHANVLEIINPATNMPLVLTAKAGSKFVLPGAKNESRSVHR
jgi:23S rRNA pseudouridine1911/1915/1917 synthase